MKLSRTRGHTINMGSYESAKFEATVEIDDITITLENEQAIYDSMDRTLDIMLAADIKETIELLPKGSESYIQVWRQNA